MSDTSFTQGVEDEFSLDEEEPAENETSVALLDAARKSLNLQKSSRLGGEVIFKKSVLITISA